MIERERLEELIKQGAIIYTSRFKKPEKYKLYKDYFVNDDKLCACNKSRTAIECVIKLNKLFETEEDARWELEMTATYTDTLKLANYTNFENENGDRVFYHKGTTFELSLWWASDNTKIIRITWNDRYGFGYIFEKPLTKENYLEACRLAKKLFLGLEDK